MKMNRIRIIADGYGTSNYFYFESSLSAKENAKIAEAFYKAKIKDYSKDSKKLFNKIKKDLGYKDEVNYIELDNTKEFTFSW